MSDFFFFTSPSFEVKMRRTPLLHQLLLPLHSPREQRLVVVPLWVYYLLNAQATYF